MAYYVYLLYGNNGRAIDIAPKKVFELTKNELFSDSGIIPVYRSMQNNTFKLTGIMLIDPKPREVEENLAKLTTMRFWYACGSIEYCRNNITDDTSVKVWEMWDKTDFDVIPQSSFKVDKIWYGMSDVHWDAILTPIVGNSAYDDRMYPSIVSNIE